MTRPKTLGIAGYGRSTGFEMGVLALDTPERSRIEDTPGVEYAELDRLLAESDFVTIQAVLSPATRHPIGDPEPTAVLVNAARGRSSTRPRSCARSGSAGSPRPDSTSTRTSRGWCRTWGASPGRRATGSPSSPPRARSPTTPASAPAHCVNLDVHETAAWRNPRRS